MTILNLLSIPKTASFPRDIVLTSSSGMTEEIRSTGGSHGSSNLAYYTAFCVSEQSTNAGERKTRDDDKRTKDVRGGVNGYEPKHSDVSHHGRGGSHRYYTYIPNNSTLSKWGLVNCSVFTIKNAFRNEEARVLERFLYYVGPTLLFS